MENLNSVDNINEMEDNFKHVVNFITSRNRNTHEFDDYIIKTLPSNPGKLDFKYKRNNCTAKLYFKSISALFR